MIRLKDAYIFIFVSFLIGAPLATACWFVTGYIEQTLKSNTFQMSQSLSIRADAESLLPLLLIQDDATKSMLIDSSKLEVYSERKIDAYDLHVKILASLEQYELGDDAQTIVRKLINIDEKKLRPLDTQILEILFSDVKSASELYFNQYEHVRQEYENLLKNLISLMKKKAATLEANIHEENRSLVQTVRISFTLGIIFIAFSCSLITIIVKRRKVHLEEKITQRTLEISASNKKLVAEMIARDKAERERSESEVKMINNAKMAALGEMAGGIAHEINNPLGVISFRAGQAKRLLNSDPPRITTAIEFLSIIEGMTERAAKIIQGLRFFSRQGDHDQFLETNLVQVIQDTTALCTEKLRSNQVDLRLKNIDSPYLIECRAVHISQVILNIINNAVDAIENLPEKWVEIAIVKNQKSTCILITDSGSGIPNHVAEKIFTPFFTTKDIGKGTGLGLSISKGLIESHGGSLRIDTTSPHTCFIIELPDQQHAKEAA